MGNAIGWRGLRDLDCVVLGGQWTMDIPFRGGLLGSTGRQATAGRQMAAFITVPTTSPQGTYRLDPDYTVSYTQSEHTGSNTNVTLSTGGSVTVALSLENLTSYFERPGDRCSPPDLTRKAPGCGRVFVVISWWCRSSRPPPAVDAGPAISPPFAAAPASRRWSAASIVPGAGQAVPVLADTVAPAAS
jgi:hypothetical protein